MSRDLISEPDKYELDEFLEGDLYLVEVISTENETSALRFTAVDNPEYFAHCVVEQWGKVWYLMSLFAPGMGTQFMLRIFQEARLQWVQQISLLARTNDETIHDQESLESWYQKFWFETLYNTANGTNMIAQVNNNRPLTFRIEDYRARVWELI